MPLLLVAWLFLASAVSMLTGCGSESSPSFPPNTNVTTGGTSTTSTTTTTGVQQQVPVKLAFVTQPGHALSKAGTSPGQATEALPPFQVAIEDASGNVVTTATGIPVTISLGSGANNAQLSGTLTVNSVNGIATFDNVIVSFAGTFTLVASSPGLQSSTSASFTVQPLALSFPTHEDFLNGGLTTAVAYGDFNGDGIQDVASFTKYSHSASSAIRVQLGNGDGTFKPAVLTALPSNHVAPFQSGTISNNTVAAADLNGDGRTDLVFSSQYVSAYGSYSSGNVFVALANADGSFNVLSTPLLPTGAIDNIGSVAVGKLSGDSTMKMAVSYYSSPGSGGTYPVRFGTLSVTGTTATFNVTTSAFFQNEVDAIVAGDFNGDSNIDFATIYFDSSRSTAYASIYAGDGKGTFTEGPSTYTALAGIPTAVAAGFINGDTKEDLLVAEAYPASNSYPVETLIGGSKGGFPSFIAQPSGLTVSNAVSAVALGKFGGDSTTDAALSINVLEDKYLTKSSNATPPFFAVETVKGNGDGTFQQSSAQQSAVAWNTRALGVADVNGDGINDVLAVDASQHFSKGLPLQGAIQTLLGKSGSIALSAPPADVIVKGEVLRTAIADVNGDGKGDVIIESAYSNGTSVVGNLSVLLSGQGPAKVTHLNTPALGLAVGDVNGDGRADVAVPADVSSGSGKQVNVWLGQTDGSFQQGGFMLTANQPVNPVLADLDGDGKLDLVAVGTYSSTGVISVALGKGDGTFGATANIFTGLSSNTGSPRVEFAVSDLNGDSRPDIVVLGGNGSSKYLETFLNNGNGGFPQSTPSSIQTVQGAKYNSSVPTLVSADFNLDGKADVAFLSVTNSPLAQIQLLEGNGDGSFQTTPKTVGTTSLFSTLKWADVNADGIPDLVVTDGFLNEVQILTGNGDGTFAPAVGFGINGQFPIDSAVGDLNGDNRPDIVAAEVVTNLKYTSISSVSGGVTILLHNP
jgi:hypothetical protein